MAEQANSLVNNRSPRYLHGFQKDTNETTELPHTVPVGSQVTYTDSFTNYGVDTVYGKEYVIAAGSSPTVHNALSGRSDADAHPASAIANTPAGTISAITVQNAINELASEKAQLAGALTNQRVPFADSSGHLTDNANFFYDSTLGLRISNTTAATSTTSGSLILGGGLGLGGAIYGGASDYSSVHILFGPVQFWRGTSRWQMRVAGGSNELGQLGAVAGLTSMSFGMGGTSAGNGSYIISRSTGTIEFYCGTTSIFAGQFDAAGDFKVNNTTASTTTTSGCATFAGGIGVAGQATLASARIVGNIGFYNTAPAAKPTVTGSRGGNAALASLLTALANLGLITDSTTA